MTKVSNDDMPEFLKRAPETPEQEEKRRKKYAPKDASGGLKVKKLPEPVDPKIAKAIKRDLDANQTAGGDVAIPRGEKPDWQKTHDSLRKAQSEQRAKRPRGHAALADLANTLPLAAKEAREDSKKGAVERINEARAKDGLRPYQPKKKLSGPLAKAMKERDELDAKAKTALANAAAKHPDQRTATERKKIAKAAKDFAEKRKSEKLTTARKAKVSVQKREDYEPRKGTKAAKVFNEKTMTKAAELIKRKGGALSSEIQKACSWKPVIVRRFVRDVARKRLGLRVVCERGPDSTYKLG